MIGEGIYRYYKLDDEGRRTPKGAIKISNHELKILSDPSGVLKHMFEEGLVDRKTLDTMQSVNRNHYAVFVKEAAKKLDEIDQVEDDIKSIYTEFAEENIDKGEFGNKLRAGAMGLALAASTLAPTQIKQDAQKPAAPQQAMTIPAKPDKEKERILASIMDVESSGGIDTTHPEPHAKAIHGKERAYGKYGLMPITIRETIKRNPELMKDHGKAVGLTGSDLHNYMDANEGLGKKIAAAHYKRLSKHFGADPAKIAYAWLNGITGTKKAIKDGVDINNHWHVIKVLNAYEKRKKQGF